MAKAMYIDYLFDLIVINCMPNYFQRNRKNNLLFIIGQMLHPMISYQTDFGSKSGCKGLLNMGSFIHSR